MGFFENQMNNIIKLEVNRLDPTILSDLLAIGGNTSLLSCLVENSCVSRVEQDFAPGSAKRQKVQEIFQNHASSNNLATMYCNELRIGTMIEDILKKLKEDPNYPETITNKLRDLLS